VIDSFVTNFQLFLLVLFRTVAMFETAPLFSSSAIPQTVKIGFAFFTAGCVFPGVLAAGYPIPSNPVEYFLLVLGEAMIGLILGFMLQMVFSAFQTAGQFFSLQMGFGASEVFDPLAQVEIPLMGEFLNLVAMLVFIAMSGGTKFLLLGVSRSFQSIRAVDLVIQTSGITETMIRGLSGMFVTAITISFPILGTLILVSITMGLLAKASPQMDVLTMGFPLSIGVAFILLFAVLPFLMTAMERIINVGFDSLAGVISGIGGVK
jgi:flagellar biosynthesis protein FliR